MHKFTFIGIARRTSKQGFTLVEVLIAATIGVLVMGAVMGLMITTLRDQRLGLVQQRVSEQADRVQDQVTELLKYGSRDAGVFLADADGAYYRKVVFRQETGAANQQLEYDPDDMTLTYDPDLSKSGGEKVFDTSSSMTTLDRVRFVTGMKVGGIPDSGVILVEIEVSDHGFARKPYRDPSNEANWVVSSRSFAVNLRLE